MKIKIIVNNAEPQKIQPARLGVTDAMMRYIQDVWLIFIKKFHPEAIPKYQPFFYFWQHFLAYLLTQYHHRKK